MVNPNAHVLASRILRINQEMTAHLIRIQAGFLATRNALQAQTMIHDMQQTLSELQKHLDEPPTPSRYELPKNFVPLK